MRKSPLISIIIPVYNRANLIEETLQTVCNQLYENWECIVVDDRSNEDTMKVVEGFVKRDRRFRTFIRSESIKKGAASCRNIGLMHAQGIFIQFLDSDDLLSPNKLQSQIEALSDQPEAIAFCGWTLFEVKPSIAVQDMDLPFHQDFYKPLELLELLGEYNTYLPVHAYLIPSKYVRQAGIWDENLSNNDDAEFLSRVLVHANKVIYVKDATAYYRKQPYNSGLSAYSDKDKISSVVRSWQKIENTLQNYFKKSHFIYVENSKKRLYRNINWENPELIIAHPKFFKKEIKESNAQNNCRLLKKVWRKLKYLIS